MAKIDNKQYTVTITDSDETISFYEIGNVFDSEEENAKEKNDIKTRYQNVNPLCIVDVE